MLFLLEYYLLYSYDCQAHGEFVIMKSTVTQRQIQGRYIKLPGRSVSVMRGFVVQDEGDTPKVQVSAPVIGDGVAQEYGEHKCRLQLFVDGVQQDLNLYENDKIHVVQFGTGRLRVLYKKSRFEVVFSLRGGARCAMSACFRLKKTSDDNIIGMLGTPNKNTDDDWMTRDGTTITTRKKRRGEIPYKYCTENWCMTDPKDSLFLYNEAGMGFNEYQHCGLSSDEKPADEIIEGATAEAKQKCGTDMECLEDAAELDIGAAADAKDVRDKEVPDECLASGASCRTGSCCAGKYLLCLIIET